MRELHLLLATIVSVLFSFNTAVASCEALAALRDGKPPNAAQSSSPQNPRSNLSGLAAACDKPALVSLVFNAQAIQQARPVKDTKSIAGHWVNDFWLSAAAGITVPAVEVLAIEPDGTFVRTMLRWVDPKHGHHRQDSNLPAVDQVLIPVLAKGRFEPTGDGSFQATSLKRFDVELGFGKRHNKALFAQQQFLMQSSMPGLTLPWQFSKTAQDLVIADRGQRVRTYRKHTAADISRAHSLILALEISAARYWRCFIKKFAADNPDLAKLRNAGDVAIKIVKIGTQMHQSENAMHNMMRKNFKQFEKLQKQSQSKMKEQLQRIVQLQASPQGAWYRKQLKSDSPLGCVVPELR